MNSVGDPWASQPIQESINQLLLGQFRGEKEGFVEIGPQKYLFPQRFAEDGASFYNFKPRSNDTWVVTFPRSGTTLTQELVWLVSNKFDFETAAKLPLTERFPFFEFSACVNKKLLADLLRTAKNEEARQALISATDNVLPCLINSNKPRFIKTHLPFSLLPPNLLTCGAKVIYVARNPKDVAVSYYHLHRLFKTLDYTGTFEEFWDHFENDHLMFCPYWSHLNEAWNNRHRANFKFIYYEDIKQDMKETIRELSKFLKVDSTAEDIDSLADHLDIKNFRNNSSVNFENLSDLLLNNTTQRFIREGVVACRPEFTSDLDMRANMWIRRHLNNTTSPFIRY